MVRLLGRACHSSDWLTASTLFLFHFPCSVLRCIYFLLWELSAFFLTFLDSIGQLGLMFKYLNIYAEKFRSGSRQFCTNFKYTFGGFVLILDV